MFLSSELVITLGLVGVAALVTIAYLIRVFTKGRAEFSRVNAQGSGPLLSKAVMEGAYWFFQPIGRFLVALGATPNQISWMSLGFGLIAGLCLVFGHFGSAAVFAAVSAIMDALDGLVARLTGVASDAGEVLDAGIDRYVEFFFLAGLAIYYREVPVLLVITLFAILGSFMVSYSTAKAEALQVPPPKGAMRRPERAVYLITGAALSPVTIPIFEIERTYGIAIGHPMVMALSLVALVSNVSAVERLIAIAKSVREREAKAEALRLAREAEVREEIASENQNPHGAHEAPSRVR